MRAGEADVLIWGVTFLVRRLKLFMKLQELLSSQSSAWRNREITNHPDSGEALEWNTDLGNSEIRKLSMCPTVLAFRAKVESLQALTREKGLQHCPQPPTTRTVKTTSSFNSNHLNHKRGF